MKAVSIGLLMLLAVAICCVDSRSQCPKKQPEDCSPPCSSATESSCPNYPNAECINRYCGGVCEAKFKTGPTIVTGYCNECSENDEDPEGDAVTCSEERDNPEFSYCSGLICKAYPNAVCYDDYCDCKAKFATNSQIIADCDICPDGSPVDAFSRIKCLEACECYPDAECSDSNYCDGLPIPGYRVDNKVVECNPCTTDQCILEDGKTRICKLYLDANPTCYNDYCGCSWYWKLPGGEILTEDDCNTCPSSRGSTSPVGPCLDDVICHPLLGATCTNYPTATCIIDEYQCSVCGNRWVDEDGQPVTCDD